LLHTLRPPGALSPEPKAVKKKTSKVPPNQPTSSKRFHFAYFWLHVKGTKTTAKFFGGGLGGQRKSSEDGDEDEENTATTAAASC